MNPFCPHDNQELVRKPIIYGFVLPDGDYGDAILGGCDVSIDSPEYGYECPKCHKTFVLDRQGQLTKFYDDEE